MKKSNLLLLTIFIAFSILSCSVYAHQPRTVSENNIKVSNPEISQAFYGELKGSPHYFEINSDSDFNFYAGILVPYEKDANKDMSFEVLSDNETLFIMSGTGFNWTLFHEDFAGDDYYWGPEARNRLGPGNYTIKVFSPTNTGKYSLAIGEIESFPLNEIINTVFTLPLIKQNFFGKPWYTAFFTLVGLFIFGPLALIIFAIIFIFVIIRRRKKLK